MPFQISSSLTGMTRESSWLQIYTIMTPSYPLPHSRDNSTYHLLTATNTIKSPTSLDLSNHIYLSKETWRFYTTNPTPLKGISLFYNLFQQKLNFTKSHPYRRWESNLGMTITGSQWQYALWSLYKDSRCINHWELSQKIALRWYLTPYRISKFGQNNSPMCWRNCGAIGNILHMFWACKHLTSFWNSIFRSIWSLEH